MKRTKKTDDMEQRWTITLNRKQLVLVNAAIEMYFRVHLGQMFDLADSLAFIDFDYDFDYEKRREEFDARIARRNTAEDMFKEAYKVAIGRPWLQRQTDEMLNLEDIWAIIRHQLWKNREEPKPHGIVDAYPPLISGTESPVEVRRLDE